MRLNGITCLPESVFTLTSMLELNEQEWSALCVADERTFVAVIRNDIVRLRPELSDDPELPDRLYRAYEEAKRLGFVHDQSIVRFSLSGGGCS